MGMRLSSRTWSSARFRALGLGSLRCQSLMGARSIRHCAEWRSSGVCACPSSPQILSAFVAARPWTGGVTMRWCAAAMGTALCDTTTSGMWCTRRPPARVCAPSARKQVFSLRALSPTGFAPGLARVDPLTFGCPVVLLLPLSPRLSTVTSGLRADSLRQSAADPGLVFSTYEASKRAYKDTDKLCSQAGLAFTPMVLEAHGGGFSGIVRGILDRIAGASAAVCSDEVGASSLRIAQRISCSLHRENARAILRRTPPPAEPDALASGWAALSEDFLWQ